MAVNLFFTNVSVISYNLEESRRKVDLKLGTVMEGIQNERMIVKEEWYLNKWK